MKIKIRNLKRDAVRCLVAWSLMGLGALAHNSYFNNLERQEIAPGIVNSDIEKCTLETPKGKYNFYLLSEIHGYNKSSSEFVRRVIKDRRVETLLTEGINAKNSERPLTERLMFAGLKPLFAGAGCTAPDPIDIAVGEGVYRKYLEEYKDGKRGGNSTIKDFGWGLGGASLCVMSPVTYWVWTPLRYCKWPSTYFNNIGERDVIIGNKAFEYFSQNPDKVVMLRVGKSHRSGVLKTLESRGKLSTTKISAEEVLR